MALSEMPGTFEPLSLKVTLSPWWYFTPGLGLAQLALVLMSQTFKAPSPTHVNKGPATGLTVSLTVPPLTERVAFWPCAAKF
jgi:hypothetical protein